MSNATQSWTHSRIDRAKAIEALQRRAFTASSKRIKRNGRNERVSTPVEALKEAQVYSYFALGFAIRSDIPLPELSTTRDLQPQAPLLISLGKIPDELKQTASNADWVSAAMGDAVVKIEDSGWIRIKNGSNVILDAHSEAGLENLAFFIAATALPIAALQTGRIPFHLSSVRIGGKVHLFFGDSGAGKSTLAAALKTLLDADILTDDLTVFCEQSARGADASLGRFHFGVKRIKLWRNSAEMLNQTQNIVRMDRFRPKKLHIAIDSEPSIPVEDIASLVSLQWGPELSLSRLPDYKKLQVLTNAVYPRRLVQSFISIHEVRRQLLRLSSIGNAFQLQRSTQTDPAITVEYLNASGLI